MEISLVACPRDRESRFREIVVRRDPAQNFVGWKRIHWHHRCRCAGKGCVGEGIQLENAILHAHGAVGSQ